MAEVDLSELDPALVPIFKRESGFNPVIGFGGVDLSTAPLGPYGFPIWEGRMGPAGISHAAGLGQFQPGTWNPIAKKLGITDFSPASQIKVANELKRQAGMTPWAASEPGQRAAPGETIDGGMFLGTVHPEPQDQQLPPGLFLNALLAGNDKPQEADQNSLLLDALLSGHAEPTGSPQGPQNAPEGIQIPQGPDIVLRPPSAPADLLSTAVPEGGNIKPLPVAMQSPGSVPRDQLAPGPWGSTEDETSSVTLQNIFKATSDKEMEIPVGTPGSLERGAIGKPPAAQEQEAGAGFLDKLLGIGTAAAGEMPAQPVEPTQQAASAGGFLDRLLEMAMPVEGIGKGIVAGASGQEPPHDVMGKIAEGPGWLLGRQARGAGELIQRVMNPATQEKLLTGEATPEELQDVTSAATFGLGGTPSGAVGSGIGRGIRRAGREPIPDREPVIEPPPSIAETRQHLDDSLYRLQKNAEADAIELRQFIDNNVSEKFKTPEFQSAVADEIENRLVDPNYQFGPDTTEYLAEVKPLTDAEFKMANRLKNNLTPEEMVELDIPSGLRTVEEGYVHRVRIGQGPGDEGLTVGAGVDPVTEASRAPPTQGTRTLSKFAPGTQERTMGFDKTMSQIEAETGGKVRYNRNHLGNLVQNVARMRRVERNIKTLDEIKPRLTEEGLWLAGEKPNQPVPEGWRPVELPQLRGYAQPRIANTLNDFYRAGLDDDNPFEKFNHFLVGSMFVLPVGHMKNVGAHYTIARGFDWLYRNPRLTRGFQEVWNQGPQYLEWMRNGGAAMYPGAANVHKILAEKLFQDQLADPQWQGLAKSLGTNIKALVKAEYDWSRRSLWFFNDALLFSRALELKETRGLSWKQAIAQSEKDIPNYRLPDQIMGSRMLKRALSSPLMVFGRYAYGRYRAIGEMAKDLAGPRATGQQRVDALGKAVVTIMLATFGQQIVDAALKKLTGNKDARMSLGGPLPMLEAGGRLAGQNLGVSKTSTAGQMLGLDQPERDLAESISSFLTISPTTRALSTLFGGGHDPFSGRPIYEPGSTKLGMATQLGEYAGSYVYPLQLAEQATLGHRGAGALGQAFGVSLPDPAARRKAEIARALEKRRALSRERKDPIEQTLRKYLP